MILAGQRHSSQSNLSQYYYVHPQILHGRVRDRTRLSKLYMKRRFLPYKENDPCLKRIDRLIRFNGTIVVIKITLNTK
jgi:hypothetical protein